MTPRPGLAQQRGFGAAATNYDGGMMSVTANKTTPSMPTLKRFALLSGIYLLCVPGWAQDGIFDDPGGLFAEPPVAAKPSAASEVDDNPLTKQLLEHARRGDLQLADSISSLARIGRWSDVDRLLPLISARKLGAATLAEMSRRIGPSIFLRMQQRKEIGKPARAAIDQLVAASVAQAESPERLRNAIDGLDSESIDTKLASARLLLGGGNVAISELVSAAALDNPSAPRDQILRVMMQFGSGGVDALRQLALYGTPPVRHRALESLSRINRKAHIVDLLTGLYAADASDAEVATAEAGLRRIDNGLPSRASALAILALDFQSRVDTARLVDNDDQMTTVWSVNAERNGVTYQPTRMVMAAYRDAADAGSRLRRVGGLGYETESDVFAADMAYRIMIDPDWGDPEQIEAIRAAYGSAATGPALSEAIARSLAVGDHAGIIGLVRLIDSGTSVVDRSQLLSSGSAVPTPLVNAASSPEPRVRYEAALAAARLAQGGRYAGSSRVMHCLSEMRALGDQPTAVLVETRRDVVILLERVLGNLGLHVEVVGSVGQLQRCVARGGDLRLILSKTELADFPPIEMIDLIRRLDRGHDLPIVFYGSDAAGIQSARWQAPTVLIDRPASVAAFDGLMDTVGRKRRLPSLTAIDRQTYRSAAVKLLGDLAQAR